MKSSKHLDNALEAAGCIEEKLKAAVEAWRADIDRFASSYELKEIDHELRLTIRQREHQLHSSIHSQCSELTCLIRNVKSDLDMIKFNRQLWSTTLLYGVTPFLIMTVMFTWIDKVK